jgi:lipid-binding SYLF domain-containing protein
MFFPLFAATALLVTSLSATAAGAPDGTIALEIYKAGFIVGGAGGSGTLTYKGTAHPVEIGGVSLGATIGISKAELLGDVYNLKSLEDIEGTYTATTVGLAVAGGDKTAELKNSKGVELKIKGKQIGLELSLDLSGLELKLKR